MRKQGREVKRNKPEIMDNLIYEQDLPLDMTEQEYSEWFKKSQIIDGVRMGPKFKRMQKKIPTKGEISDQQNSDIYYSRCVNGR